VRLGFGPARLTLGRDQALEPAGLLFDEVPERAGRNRLPLSAGQSRGELGQPRLVVIDSEDELDDRGHWRARLRLHARFLEKLGIFVRTLLRRDREVVSERQSAIERSAGTAFARLNRLRRLTRSPQAVG